MRKIIVTASLLFFIALIPCLCAGFARGQAPRDVYSGLSGVLRDYDGAYEAIRQGALDGEVVINISLHGIKEKDIVPLFTDVISSCPELFFLNSTFTYSYSTFPPEHPVNSITLSYRLQGRELREAVKDYEDRVSSMVSLVEPGLTDAEKALFVHDCIISLYSYDSSLTVYDAYGMLTGGSGVCRSYSLLYMDILDRLGIDCAMVTSDEMVHAWNIVKIDGKWYHVDLTYDDPMPERTGQALHDYFLLSDEEIASAEKPHRGWRSTVQCPSSYAGSPFWDGVRTKMAYLNGNWYYLDTEAKSLMKTDRSGRRTFVTAVGGIWYNSPSRSVSWAGMFAAPDAYGGFILYNTPDSVMAYDPASGKTAGILYVGEDSQVTGMTVRGDALYIQKGFDVNAGSTQDTETVLLSGTVPAWRGESSLPFRDISASDRYYEAILDVYDRGIFLGVSDTEFAPDKSLTRAMFVTILGRTAGIAPEDYGRTVFGDVPSGEWYSPYVTWAYEAGVVSGTGSGMFSPSSPLTREQMLKIAYSFLLRYGYAGSTLAPDMSELSDAGEISDWALEPVRFASALGLTGGLAQDGRLRPRDPATRAEAAYVISVICRKTDR